MLASSGQQSSDSPDSGVAITGRWINDSSVDPSVSIGEKSSVKRCNIGKGCCIGEKVKISHCVIGENVVIEAGASIQVGSLIELNLI